MQAGRAWEGSWRETGWQTFPAESELEILPSVSAAPERYLRMFFLRSCITCSQGVMESLPFHFWPPPGGERPLQRPGPGLFISESGSLTRAMVPVLVWLLWPHSCFPYSRQRSTRKVLSISDSQRDRKSQAGPPFLPALGTSWATEPQATTSLESRVSVRWSPQR